MGAPIGRPAQRAHETRSPARRPRRRRPDAVADKGIHFFDDIDQQSLAAGAEIMLRPSQLLVFGNPPPRIKFLTSNPYTGPDWPVRMLVTQDDDGQVWIAYTDFAWFARAATTSPPATPISKWRRP